VSFNLFFQYLRESLEQLKSWLKRPRTFEGLLRKMVLYISECCYQASYICDEDEKFDEHYKEILEVLVSAARDISGVTIRERELLEQLYENAKGFPDVLRLLSKMLKAWNEECAKLPTPLAFYFSKSRAFKKVSSKILFKEKIPVYDYVRVNTKFSDYLNLNSDIINKAFGNDYELYKHQHDALKTLNMFNRVLVITPNASGKTEIATLYSAKVITKYLNQRTISIAAY